MTIVCVRVGFVSLWGQGVIPPRFWVFVAQSGNQIEPGYFLNGLVSAQSALVLHVPSDGSFSVFGFFGVNDRFPLLWLF